jgi:hypothetical protein
MALRTRRRSTCRRTTSSGSVTVISTALHVTTLNVQSMSGMWTVRSVTSVGMPVATCGFEPLFPRRVALDAARGGPARGGRADAGRARRKSALPDPVEQRLGRGLRRRLMLAVAPGAARALLVVALAARDADHALYCPALRAVLVIVRCCLSCGAVYRAVLVVVRCSPLGTAKAAATV